MPTPTKYTYSNATDFGGNFNIDRCILDIEAEPNITISLDPQGIEVVGDVIDIWFKDVLPSADKNSLDGDTAQTPNSPPGAGSVLGGHTGTAPTFSPETIHVDAETTEDGRLRVATEKSSIGRRSIIISHDWTDRTTWYQNASRIVDEVLTLLTEETTPPGSPTDGDKHVVGPSATGDFAGQEGKIAHRVNGAWTFIDTPSNWTSGANKAYTMANDSIIDTYHAKLPDEDFMVDASSNSFRVSVTVNDVAKTEDDPHYIALNGQASNSDYHIDYDNGLVLFHTALSGETVKATYHHSTDSIYRVYSKSTEILKIETVEVQFSDPVNMLDTTVFQIRGRADKFPEIGDLIGTALPNPTGWTIGFASAIFKVYPWGTLTDTIAATDVIPFSQKTYKSMKDFQDECTKSYPQYPPLGGSGWRGLTQATQPYHWEYQRQILLHGGYEMDIISFLHHDEPFVGEFATATFYGVIESIS